MGIEVRSHRTLRKRLLMRRRSQELTRVGVTDSGSTVVLAGAGTSLREPA
jgi:hypothetical protein